MPSATDLRCMSMCAAMDFSGKRKQHIQVSYDLHRILPRLKDQMDKLPVSGVA